MQKSQIAEKYDDFLTSQNGQFWTFDKEGTTKEKIFNSDLFLVVAVVCNSTLT